MNKRLLTVLVFVLALASVAAGADDMKLLPEGWSIRPRLATPMLAKAPVIDGVVQDAEWQDAGMTDLLFSNQTGCLAKEPVYLYYGWREGGLYLAWKIHRPAGYEKPKVTFPAGHQRFIWTRDDNIELSIEPGSRKNGIEHFYAFAGNAGSAWCNMFGKLGGSEGDVSWQGGWDYKSSVTPYGWQGEVFIPQSQFVKAEPVKPGNRWFVAFYVNRQTPKRDLVCLSNIWGLHGGNSSEKKAEFIFTDSNLTSRAEKAGVLDSGRMGVSIDVNNRNSAPARLTMNWQIFKAKPSAGKRLGFMEIWDKLFYTETTGKRIQEGKEIIFDKGPKEYLKDMNDNYAFVDAGSTSVTVAPRARSVIAGGIKPDFGEFLMAYTLVDEKNQVVAHQVTPVMVSRPLETQITPYFLEWGRIRAITSLDATSVKDGDRMVFTLTRDGSSKPVNVHTVKIASGAQNARAWLAVPDDRAARYTLKVVQERGKSVVEERTFTIDRPQNPSWWKNGLGEVKTPPAPFTPLKTSLAGGASKVSLWNRDFTFKNSLLPVSIVSRGDEILASPAELKLAVGGRDVDWKSVKLAPVSVNACDAVYSYKAVSDALSLEGTVKVHYDGMMRFDVQVKPLAKNVKVDSMELRLPVKKQYATLYASGNWYTDPLKYRIASEIPGSDGAVTGWRKFFPKGIPFTYKLFLGCEDRGIEWFAENDRNWSNASEESAIDIDAGEKAVTLVVKTVDKPLTLTEPKDFTWGIMVTPLKDTTRGTYVLSRRWGDNPSILGQEGESQALKNNLAAFTTGVPKLWSVYVNMSDTGDFGTPRPYSAKWEGYFRRSAERVHQAAGKDFPIIYYSSWGVNKNFPGFEPFGREMIMEPFYDAGYDCYWHNPASKAYQDWYLDGVKWMVENVGMCGVKLDGTWDPRLTTNELYGYGWTRDGREHGSYPVFALRDFAERLYGMLHGGIVENGVVDLHSGGGYFVYSFADLRHFGETEYKAGNTISRICSLEQYRLRFMTQLNGVPTMQLWAEWMNLPVKGNEMRAISLLHGVMLPAYSNSAMGAALTDNDYEREARPWASEVRILDAFGVQNAEWIPYWKGNPPVRSADPAVLSSVWLRKGEKALVVLSNLGLEGRKVDLVIDKDALGFTKPRILVKDAMKDTAITAETNGIYSISIYPQGYRLLEISNR